MIELLIDDVLLDFDLASTMFQSLPAPGGHTYRLIVHVDPELFDFLKPGEYDNLSADVASRVLGRLTRQLRSASKRPCQYYLNSIDHLIVSTNFRLLLCGVCSVALVGGDIV